jgi:LysM repeat protein
MAAIELIKENIEYEQLLGENSADTVVKGEYLIPDTHPDVAEILMVDVKPTIVNKEVLQDKVYLEGQLEYNVLYLAKEEERMGVHNVSYTDKFSNYVDIKGAEHKMSCEAEHFIEHMDCTIVNERKIALGGIIKLKSAVYKDYRFEIVKDLTDNKNVQMLKSPTTVDKIVGTASGDLIAKSHLQVSMDRPQIGNVLKCDVNIHKKEVKLLEDKVQVTAFAIVELLYRGKDTRDIVYMKDDVYLTKDMELLGVQPSMEVFSDFKVDAMEYNVKEDDLGERRLVDVEALINSSVKVMYKDEIDMIEDAYSPQMLMELSKKDYALNVMHGQNAVETIVKENLELDKDRPKPISVVMTTGKVAIVDKKLVENKVMVEGILNVDVLYRSSDEDKYVSKISDQLPFNCSVDISGSKIDMQCVAKAALESIEASVEANTIAVKAVVGIQARVNYVTYKDFLVEITSIEEEIPKKKSSITIYVAQPGDTLWKIAKKYLTTKEQLVKINSLDDTETIKIGQKFIIPGRAII